MARKPFPAALSVLATYAFKLSAEQTAIELAIAIDRSAPLLLSHQISRAIMDMITCGALPSGTRLPATRELANRLCVSRTTVVEAYDLLADQGYVSAQRGSGTRVEPRVADLISHDCPAPLQSNSGNPPPGDKVEIDFRPDLPDLASFPKRQWLASLVRGIEVADLDVGEPLGSLRLRQAIASYLGRSRGLHTAPNNIVITAGNIHGFEVILRLLSGIEEVLVEPPGAVWLNDLLCTHRLLVRDSALLPEDGIRRLAYVTSGHRWPRGCATASGGDHPLICWAEKTQSYIVENDDDREFALRRSPAPPMAALDSRGRVIYSYTFAKTLAPALRIGFLVLPPELLGQISSTITPCVDRGGSLLHQLALAEWLETGAFERHVHNMRRLYRERSQLLTGALTSLLENRVRIIGEPLGTHVVAMIRTRLSTEELRRKMESLRVQVHPAQSQPTAIDAEERGLVLGFGNLTNQEILRGVGALSEVVLGSV